MSTGMRIGLSSYQRETLFDHAPSLDSDHAGKRHRPQHAPEMVRAGQDTRNETW